MRHLASHVTCFFDFKIFPCTLLNQYWLQIQNASAIEQTSAALLLLASFTPQFARKLSTATSMSPLFRSRRSESAPESSRRGLGKLFSKLRRGSDVSSSSFSSSFSDSDWEDGPVRMLRPRDTIVTSIDTSDSEPLLLSPRSRRAEQRRSSARASM